MQEPSPGFLMTDHVSELVTDEYDIDLKNPIACGCYSWTHLARCKRSGEKRIIKTIPRELIGDISGLQKHLQARALTVHPGIARLYETFQDWKYVYLILEYVSGGELLDRIILFEKFSEAHISLIMKQILAAMHYSHRFLNSVYLDLKLGNLMISSPGSATYATGGVNSAGVAGGHGGGGEEMLN
jgi:serine/threonine protein kinase